MREVPGRAAEGHGRPTPGRVLLITGRPGAGKTTVLRRAAALLPSRRIAGFYTEEIRAGGRSQGFRLVTFDGRAAVMAHLDVPGPARVGKYGVRVEVIDQLATTALALRPDVDLYLVDEIGAMECLSAVFVAAMRRLLDSGRPVVATVSRRGAGFMADVRRRPDAELWEATPANRDELPARVAAWVRRRGG